MRKLILIILLIILLILIYPPIGVLILAVILIYKIYPKIKIKSKNNIEKVKTLLISLVKKDFKKIYLKENIVVFKIEKNIYLLKKGFKYVLICSLNCSSSVDIRNLTLIEGVYYIINEGNINILIAEEFFAFKLSETILKAKILRLLNKLEIVISSLSSSSNNVSLIEPKLLVW